MGLVKRATASEFDVASVRADFPILGRLVHGKPLVYLDNAASSQKPECVIDAVSKYYREQNANIHRSVHYLSELATVEYEKARDKVRKFINASDRREIIFVRGGTEAINLVAATFGRKNIGEGDEVLISHMEHHANIVPWQLLREQTGAVLRVAPINDEGELILDDFEKLLTPKTKLVAITHISNALGTINPVKAIVAMAHDRQIPVLLDGAQAVPHCAVDVQDLDCDFYAFSGHKMFAPTGIGVLYGKMPILESMPPYQGGGDMILSVTFDKTTYNELPYHFEAGTPNIAGAIGLGVAIDYLEKIGMDRIEAHERELLEYATEALTGADGVRLLGTAREKAAVFSFLIEGAHPHDAGTIINEDGIAVRTGHHCAQPVMDRYDVAATVRASLALYNTKAEVDALVQGIARVRDIFR